MQIRRLVKSGLSSFTVALPKDWIESNKLKKGDFLYIDEKDNILNISAKFKKEAPERKELVIHTEGKSQKRIRREIRSAYINDYYRIYIKGSNIRPIVREIKKDIHDLVSLETIDEAHNKIIARSFLDFSDVSVNDLIRRIDNITRSMLSDSIASILKYPKEYDPSQIITERDADVNRLTFLVFKIMKKCVNDVNVCKKLGLSYLEILKYWHLAFIIEKIADEVKRITRLIKRLHENKVKVNKKNLAKLYQEVKENYENLMKAFYKRDFVLSDEIYTFTPTLMNKCEKYFEDNKSVETSEIAGKLKGIVSQSADISKVIRYLN